MAIKDIQAKTGQNDVVGTISEKGDVREFEKFGKQGRVCNASVKDETGEIKLTLWNEQIDQVKVGDKVQITNGWCNEWQGEKQLSTGKFGKLEVLESGGDAPAPAADDKPQLDEELVQDEEEIM